MELKRVVEALLFASKEPLKIKKIAEIIGDGVAASDIRRAIRELQDEYEQTGRSFGIVEVARGYQLRSRPEFSEYVRKLYKIERSENLSVAALETLAIIAYRQPITRAEIEHIRGVNVEGVLRTLLSKRFIKVVGHKQVPGRPLLYGTSEEFLKHFGLRSLADLPKLDDVAGDVNAGKTQEAEG